MKTAAKISISVLCVLTIIVVGNALAWYQVVNTTTRMNTQVAHRALLSIETLLDEAKKTADHAQFLLSEDCTPRARAVLESLAINTRHIRLINLYRNDVLHCSSFSDMSAVRQSYQPYIKERLSILAKSSISPDENILVLQNDYPEGMVTTSISTVWFSEAMAFVNDENHMILKVLNEKLALIGHERTGDTDIYLKSQKYPFSLAFSSGDTISLSRFLRESWLTLLLSMLLALMTGGGLWRYRFRRQGMYENLFDAIKNGEIVPWYQPIVFSRTGDVYGVEVLARWITASGEVISPASFIPLAEQSGLIVPLTRCLMKQASKELPARLYDRATPFHVSFNITTASLMEPGFTEDCLRFIRSFPEGSLAMTVELLERDTFERVAELQEKLYSLQAHNIKIALDDFGTGYANLNFLNALPIEIVKIDKLFIKGLTREEDSTRLIDAVIGMAKSLNMKVLVEGVETEFQVNYLRDNEVDYFQGYYFSRPVPAQYLWLKELPVQDDARE